MFMSKYNDIKKGDNGVIILLTFETLKTKLENGKNFKE